MQLYATYTCTTSYVSLFTHTYPHTHTYHHYSHTYPHTHTLYTHTITIHTHIPSHTHTIYISITIHTHTITIHTHTLTHTHYIHIPSLFTYNPVLIHSECHSTHTTGFFNVSIVTTIIIREGLTMGPYLKLMETYQSYGDRDIPLEHLVLEKGDHTPIIIY